MGNTPRKYDTLLQKYKQWMDVQRGNSEGTIETMMKHTKKFIQWMDDNGKTIEDIDQDTVDNYVSYIKQKYSQNSLVPIIANLRKFLIHFLKKEVNIKMVQMTAPDIDKTPFTREEVKAIFREASDSPLAEAILKTLYYSGIRSSELVALNIEDIDLDRLQITVKHGKGDRSRTVNITRDCAMAIQRWLQIRPKAKKGHRNALFISSYRSRISPTFLRKIVKEYASRAGINRQVYIHKFRISMITHMAENGCTLNEIQIQSGHKDISVLLGYIQHTPQRIRKAYDKVFDDNKLEPLSNTKKVDAPKVEDADYYKKAAFQRYLAKEIDRNMLDTMLQSFEDKGKPPTCNKDYAYL